MIILVCGLPGSGKTTLAGELAEKISAVHISSDVIRKEIIEKPRYSEDEKLAVYRTMAQSAQELVRGGDSVVLDATFSRREYHEIITRMARRNDERLWVIHCVLGEEETKKRLELRETCSTKDAKGKGLSDADFDVYLKLKAEFEPITGKHLEVNAALSAEKQLELVLKYIGWKEKQG